MRKYLSLLIAVLFSSTMMALEANVTIHASSGDYYAKTNGWVTGSNSGPAYDQVVLDGNITANRIGTGNNGKYYQDWRFYTNGSEDGSFSIDAASGYELESVTLEFSVSNSGALYSGEKQVTSKNPFEVSGNKAVFQCKNTNTATNGQVRLTKIAVVYRESGGEEPPVVSNMKTIYCKMEHAWWKADGAAVAAFAWKDEGEANANFPGVRMTPVKDAEDLWQIDLDLAKYEKVIFARVNGSGDIANWGAQTEDLIIPTDEKDLFTITNKEATWIGDGKVCVGEWSKYEAGGETPPEPPVVETKDLQLAPGVWTADNAVLAAWAWQEGAEGAWSVFEGEGDTLLAKINALADSVIFVRFKGGVEPDWKAEIWNRTENQKIEKCALFFVNDWDKYSWCEKEGGETPPEPPVVETKDLQLAPGVWTTDNAVLAAWAWQTGAEGAWSVFEGEGDVLKAEINALADSVIFVRFKNGVKPDWSAEIWNRTENQKIEDCALFFVNDWDNYSWCEKGGGEEPPVNPNAIILKFNGTGNDGKDSSSAFDATVEAIFDKASQAHVSEVTEATRIYAGRPIDGDNSSVKFGTTSAQGVLTFKLAEPIDAESIVVNATQYGNNESKISVNGTEFTLNAGNKKPQDCVLKPKAAVSEITIAQSSSERLYLRYIQINPKSGDTPPEPPVGEKKELRFAPGVWTIDNAVLAAWVWGKEAAGEWAVFAGEGDTLLAEINALADSVIFVRFKDGLEPNWNAEIWNRTEDMKIEDCALFFVNDWNKYSWCEKDGGETPPEPPVGDMIEVRLVPGVWNVDGAKFACLTLNSVIEGEIDLAKLLASAVISDWFEGGDTVVGKIPADTKLIAFGRFNPSTPSLDIMTIMGKDEHDNPYLWNRSDILLLDPSLIYTITDWGGDYSPGYWGEKPIEPEVLEDGFYLIGQNGWDINALSKDLKFILNRSEPEYMLEVTLVEGQPLKVVKVENGAIVKWYPDGMGNEYVVDADHAGEMIIYFKENQQGGDWSQFGGFMFIAPKSGTGVDNTTVETKAQKMLRNGQVLIIRGEHIYTPMGQMVK